MNKFNVAFEDWELDDSSEGRSSSVNLFPGTKPQAETSDSQVNPFEVTASVIYDEIFDGALKVLPDNILSCLRNAQHVQKIIYDKYV